jgi:hypothetical protein
MVSKGYTLFETDSEQETDLLVGYMNYPKIHQPLKKELTILIKNPEKWIQ